MRLASLMFTLIVVQSAHAGTALWVLTADDLIYQNAPIEYKILFPSGQEWNIPAPVPLEEYILDATTAASYGFDWNAWQTFFTAGGSFQFFAEVQYPSLGTNYPPAAMRDFLNGTRVNVSPGSENPRVRTFFQPVASPGYVYSLTYVFGENVPEPASAALILWGLCLCSLRCARVRHRPTV
jgi:hypothetical protein